MSGPQRGANDTFFYCTGLGFHPVSNSSGFVQNREIGLSPGAALLFMPYDGGPA
jgi:hypothetical protein